MTLPLVRAFSQADGGPLQWQNCTATSGARLLYYATKHLTTGSVVRSKQSDQSGGTSLPDIMRALHRGWSFEPAWAAPNDTNAGRDGIPANKQGDFISPTKLASLLDDGNMAIVQGDYGDLPIAYRESLTFRDDHAFTVDGRGSVKGVASVYVVDTIPRYGTGYDGRWIPWTALLAYSTGLTNVSGRVYAAWGKPLPDTSTGDDMAIFEITDASGPYPVTVDAGAPLYDQTGKQTGTINAPTTPFLVIGESEDGKRVFLHGRGATPRTALGLTDKAKVNR